jgi:hypothetical protein
VIGVHTSGYDDVTEGDAVPQRPSHPDEEHCGRRVPPDGPFGEDGGRTVSLSGHRQRHPASRIGQVSDLEASAAFVLHL